MPRLTLARPATLHGYILRLFLPIFLGALAFFALIVELIDLFGNLWRYLSLEVPVLGILKVAGLYAPTCLSYALPVALLFATAYTLGSLYARNELIAVFSSGVRLGTFVLPLLGLGLLVSGASFFFSDGVVLSSYREKTQLSQKLLGQTPTRSNADVALISADGRVVYKCAYYDDGGKTLNNLTIVERDPEGRPQRVTHADLGRWDGKAWTLTRVKRFTPGADGAWAEADYGSLSDPLFTEPPETFRAQNYDVKEMSVRELEAQVAFLRRSGLPFRAALAERHKRFAFSLTPFVVIFISSALGGSFRRNVLLMSLLSSLLLATAYYIVQMVALLFAKTGILPPALGAWFPVIAFTALAAGLFGRART